MGRQSPAVDEAIQGALDGSTGRT